MIEQSSSSERIFLGFGKPPTDGSALPQGGGGGGAQKSNLAMPDRICQSHIKHRLGSMMVVTSVACRLFNDTAWVHQSTSPPRRVVYKCYSSLYDGSSKMGSLYQNCPFEVSITVDIMYFETSNTVDIMQPPPPPLRPCLSSSAVLGQTPSRAGFQPLASVAACIPLIHCLSFYILVQ